MSDNKEIATVAIVGAGLIGIGWAVLFVNAGLRVRLFDRDDAQRDEALIQIETELRALDDAGLANGHAAADLVTLCDTVEQAVAGSDYVQESVLETVPAKSAVASAIDACLPQGVLVGSSSSGIPASQFTETLTNRDRFFVVHPVNPPHLIPVVEIVPAPWSDPAHIPPLRAFMTRVGQQPVVVQREIPGFILNRLQGALLNEAWALHADGYASVADIDLTVSAGLGLRWSMMGPFETIDLNAPDGIEDYAERLGGLYHDIALSRRDPRPWPSSAVADAASELQTLAAARTRDDRIKARNAWLRTQKSLKQERR